MWFKELTGLDSDSPAHIRSNVTLEGKFLTSLGNNRRMQAGVLTTPTLTLRFICCEGRALSLTKLCRHEC